MIIPIHSSELKLSVERKNIHLNNDKLFKKTKHKMIGIDDGLESMVNAYNNNYSWKPSKYIKYLILNS